MVRLQTLDLRIGVRVPASQPLISKTSGLNCESALRRAIGLIAVIHLKAFI